MILREQVKELFNEKYGQCPPVAGRVYRVARVTSVADGMCAGDGFLIAVTKYPT